MMDDEVERPVSSLIIDCQEYETVRMIGKGTTAVVDLVRDKSGREYAIKFLKVSLTDRQQQQYFIREIEIMAQANHPALLRLVGCALPNPQDESAAIVMDYMPRGSLFEVLELEKVGQAPRDWNMTRKLIVILGLAGGMRYLHARSIIHRDLKSENVLFDDSLGPHIADFGLSRIITRDDPKGLKMTRKIGTPIYMAPELFQGQTYDQKVDVYAFAILTYEILSSMLPFADIPNPVALGVRVAGGVRPPIPPRVPEPWARLIRRCWAPVPSARPEFDEIVDVLWSDDLLMPDCDREVVKEYRAKVFPARRDTKILELQRQEIAKLKADFGAEIARLRAHAASLRGDNQSLQREVEALNRESDELKRALQDHEARIGDFRGVLTNAGSELTTLLQADEDLGRLASQATSEFRRYTDRLTALKKRLDREDQPGRRPASAPQTDLLPVLAKKKIPVVVSGASLDEANGNRLQLLIDPSSSEFWTSSESGDAWICLNFGDHKVSFTSYLLKSAPMPPDGKHLKSWVLEGSVDSAKWETLDTVDADSRLNSPSAAVKFECRPAAVKFVRLRQTGPSHAGTVGFSIAKIELFGALM
jgi:FtsZ-binding cell division protein ZapB